MKKIFQRLFQKLDNMLYYNIDEESSVRPDGRDGFRYKEGNRELRFQADLLVGKPQRVIYSSTIGHWLPPHDNEVLTDVDRKRILKKICTYFDSTDQSYEIG